MLAKGYFMNRDPKGSEGLDSTKSTSDNKPHYTTSNPNRKDQSVVYEHVPIGIVESSPDGKYLDVNEEFCQVVGYERDELLQLGIKDVTHEDDYSIDITLHQQLLQGKIPFYRLEKRYVRKDGSSVWVELTRSLVRDADGKP